MSSDTNPPEDSRPLLFISHKHTDSKIADVIRTFVTMSTLGYVDVYQSSTAWAQGPEVGRSLNKQLREKLWKASILILLYTDAEKDWNYCMWECGVASHPESPETKIILFNCNLSSPGIFADQVSVNLRHLVDIQKFTNDFLTSPDFFPGYNKAITNFQKNGQEVASAAADFCQKLQEVLPVPPPEYAIDWPAFPFLQLQLQAKEIEAISKAKPVERLQIASELILKDGTITAADKYCEQLFGMPNFAADLSLIKLVDSWKETFTNSQSKWVETLCSQITDGAMWRFPKPVIGIMQGLADDNWYTPILTRVRKIPSDGSMQFDIYFYKFIADHQKHVIEIPLPQ
jgi:hypothetical protein